MVRKWQIISLTNELMAAPVMPTDIHQLPTEMGKLLINYATDR